MATLARRGWDEILTEVINRAGGLNYDGWDDRASQFISAAYFDICSLYRHIELETSETLTPTTNNIFYAIPAGDQIHHVLFLYEFEVDGSGNFVPKVILNRKDYSVLIAGFNVTAVDRPRSYAISVNPHDGSRIVYFDCLLDQPRNYLLYYQTLPERPDFSSTETPFISPIWDEHLIELSLAKIGIAVGDQQLAAVNSALFKDFTSAVAQPLLQDSFGAATPEAPLTNKMPTGKLP